MPSPHIFCLVLQYVCAFIFFNAVYVCYQLEVFRLHANVIMMRGDVFECICSETASVWMKCGKQMTGKINYEEFSVVLLQ